MSHTSPTTAPPAGEFLPDLRPVTVASTSPFEETETVWEIDQTPHWRSDPRYRAILDRSEENGDIAWSYWMLAAAGTTLAGAAYGLPFFVIGAVFGFCIAGTLSLFLTAPFAIAVRTTTGAWRHPLAAPCFGGIIGFLSTASVWDELWRGDFIVFVLGPMTTTAVGQAGAYLMTRRDAAAMVARLVQRPLRISIRAMLVTTAWVAVSVAALEGCGLLEPPHLLAIVVWAPWQLCLLAIVWAVAARRARREQQLLASRST